MGVARHERTLATRVRTPWLYTWNSSCISFIMICNITRIMGGWSVRSMLLDGCAGVSRSTSARSNQEAR